MNDFTKESACCGARLIDPFYMDKDEGLPICSNCERICQFTEVCNVCDGTGIIDYPPRQVHSKTRGTYIEDGYTKPCVCQVKQSND